MRTFIPYLSILFFLSVLMGCASSGVHENIAEAKEDFKKVNAIYIGLIDSHSIEVIIDQTPTALQISEEQYKTLESIPPNTSVTISYTFQKNTSQNILEDIEISEEQKRMRLD
ncbi:hypothetical protein [Bacillus sp. J37]|uniref:hypothetical protein n=1 Tax=Bacillus sp. J37 TaxID=935837 RepID=UPI00047AC153|nr:hypothetical protein [Bacillus sp. J37]